MSQEEKYICHMCVGDRFLSAEIEADGNIQHCLRCKDDEEACWSLGELAERVKDVFDEHYELTPSEPEPWQYAMMRDKEIAYDWYRDGDSVETIVSELIGLPESFCEKLVSLWQSETFRSYKDPDYEDPYGDDARYELASSSHAAINKRWEDLQSELLHRTRFFSRSTREFLDDLFADVHRLKGYKGPVIQTYQPDTFEGVYRARVAYNDDDVRKILKGLPNQLGALRGRSVSAGRMNAAGVTVMYAAFQESTCIAEVRAPVGSQVVIGKFNLLRPIRVLNLKVLELCYDHVSLFDPDHQKISDRLAFLRSLSERLSAPVFNHNAHLDYLATQCIAEYIASIDPQIDGVAFSSAQAGDEGMNLVLFDDACHISPLDHPEGTIPDIHYRSYEEDGSDVTPCLVFYVPDANGESVKQVDEFTQELKILEAGKEPKIQPTLSLDMKSISVHNVKAVAYRCEKSSVDVSDLRLNPDEFASVFDESSF